MAPCLLVSFAGAVLIRRYAMISGMIDVPGRRSSHSVPTPRGGGLPGAAAWLAAVGAVHFLGLLEVRWALALISGGFICLAAGWLEDRFGLPAIIRFALHIVAGVAVLYWGGGLGRLKSAAVSCRWGSSAGLSAYCGWSGLSICSTSWTASTA